MQFLNPKKFDALIEIKDNVKILSKAWYLHTSFDKYNKNVAILSATLSKGLVIDVLVAAFF
jgi:hypothetical protein